MYSLSDTYFDFNSKVKLNLNNGMIYILLIIQVKIF